MNEIVLFLEHDGYSKEALYIYEELGKVFFYDGSNFKKAEDVYILVVRLAYFLNETFLQKFPNLKFIVSPTTGLNHIDLEYCKKHEIEIVSLKDETNFLETISSTAEFAFALMLTLVRKIPQSRSVIFENKIWQRNLFRGRELSCLTLGILGFGRLGRKMLNYARPFGMNVLVCDSFIEESVLEEYDILNCSKEELFQKSDVITVHVDYRKENENMISSKEFSLMKSGSYFINTSRGELVDESALLDVLKGGRIAGAALDVLVDEQRLDNIFTRPLIRYAQENDNLIITPHIGGCTLEAMDRTELFVVRKLKRLLEVIGDK